MSKPIQTIAFLTVVITVGLLLFNRPDPTMPEPSKPDTVQIKPTKVVKAASKRVRKGPRRPPPAAMAIRPDEHEGPDDDLTEQERKLEKYLHHFEALDNPDIDELTMLGELAFEAQENQAAYDHYLEVIDEHHENPKAAFALYKLAWTEYNLGDIDAAIDDMKLMLEWIESGESPLEEMLRKSGPTDLALFEQNKNR